MTEAKRFNIILWYKKILDRLTSEKIPSTGRNLLLTEPLIIIITVLIFITIVIFCTNFRHVRNKGSILRYSIYYNVSKMSNTSKLFFQLIERFQVCSSSLLYP